METRRQVGKETMTGRQEVTDNRETERQGDMETRRQVGKETMTGRREDGFL
jgi:hypothetical protein